MWMIVHYEYKLQAMHNCIAFTPLNNSCLISSNNEPVVWFDGWTVYNEHTLVSRDTRRS